jgi:hypothetical protein
MTGNLAHPDVSPVRRGAVPVPARFKPVLAWLGSDSAALLGIPGAQFEAVAYEERPFSYVLKVAVYADGGAAPDRHLFIKIFKAGSSPDDVRRMRERVQSDFEKTRELYDAMSRWPGLGTVRPVAYSIEHLASVTEEAPGETLLAHLQTHAAWLSTDRDAGEPEGTMKRVGAWLRAFQSTAPPVGRVSIDDLRRYIDIRLERLTSLPLANFTGEDRRRALQRIEQLGAAADPVDLEEVRVHRDLAPGNILVSRDRITVLDFAMSGTGSRLHDLTRLFLQIELVALKPQFRRSVLRRAARALLEGFDTEVTTDRPMFRLLSLLHHVNHLGTLAKSRAPFPVNAYNWHVRRAHRAWIERELRMTERGA